MMAYLNSALRDILVVCLSVAWLAGLVLAKGFWLTTLGIFLPFYSWYLVVEKIMAANGF